MRRTYQEIGNVARALGADRSGNFAVLTAVAASVLALSVGFAVDVVQLYNVKSGLQNALDAAITSTARDLTTGAIKSQDARATFEAFFFANGDPEAVASNRVVLDQFEIDKAAKTVAATAYMDADLFFPLFRSGPTQRIGVESAAIYSDKAIEVAMMLDVTGSMKKTSKSDKIGDLRKAATNAVNALLGSQDETKPRVRVAIVPYAEAVNTGGLSDAVFVEQKGQSNLPPSIDSPISASAGAPHGTCATERKNKDGSADFSSDGPYAEREDNNRKRYLARVNLDDRITKVWKNGKSVPKCPDAEIIPLTADKQKLLDTIADFEADGFTGGGIAVQWGYYMLSPSWRGAIAHAGLGSGPANYNTEKISKVAILMTDGQFNTAFAGVPDWETPQNQQGSKSRNYAESLCENMKRDGVEIFTIGFNLDDPGMSATEKKEAKAVLKDCSSPDASSIKHYYEASTGTDLDSAFQSIIGNIERLAITR
jgi:Flp pilus assembly protein TadG